MALLQIFFNSIVVVQARPLFKDRRNFAQMADRNLYGQFPVRGLFQALAIAAMCLHEQAASRPLIADVVTALNFLASQSYHRVQPPMMTSVMIPEEKVNVGNASSRSRASNQAQENVSKHIAFPMRGKEREQAVAAASAWKEKRKDEKDIELM
jgi:hypothetical protein